MNPTKSSQTDWGLRGLFQCWTDVLSDRLLRRGAFCLTLLAFLFLDSGTALACVCGKFPWPSIEETATSVDAVALGLVVGRGGRDGRPSDSNTHAAYVDIEVLEAIKGLKAGITLRVWDIAFGTDCDTGFSSLKGSVLALALRLHLSKDEKTSPLSRFAANQGDYYLFGACEESVREVKSAKDAAPLVETIRARLRQKRP
ncbi:MAG: hypothetical protein K1Y01_18805 [Vicinamibacteria bacterium]|nr:hypothetical protein [Vicinamibacteria bacterium]